MRRSSTSRIPEEQAPYSLGISTLTVTDSFYVSLLNCPTSSSSGLNNISPSVEGEFNSPATNSQGAQIPY